MTNTSTKRVRYFYCDGIGYSNVEMLWAANPVTDTAYWWSGSDGWRKSAMVNGCLQYFEKQPHLHPVSLYQVQHMNPKPFKRNVTTTPTTNPQ
jgi:hypothetical protein